MAKGYKFKRITQDEYERIKQFQLANIKPSVAARLLGRTAPTIGAIYKSKSWVDYKKPVKAQPKEAKETKPTKQDEVVTLLQAIDEKYQDVLTQLEAISTSVKWIENHTEVKPRTRLFG